MDSTPKGWVPESGAETCASLRATGERARSARVRRAAARAARPAAAGRFDVHQLDDGQVTVRAGEARDRVILGDLPGLEHADVEAGPAGGREALDPVRLPHPGRRPSRESRRRPLDERRADAEAVADLHLAGPSSTGSGSRRTSPAQVSNSRALRPTRRSPLRSWEVERLVEPRRGPSRRRRRRRRARADAAESRGRPAPCGSRSRSCVRRSSSAPRGRR